MNKKHNNFNAFSTSIYKKCRGNKGWVIFPWGDTFSRTV